MEIYKKTCKTKNDDSSKTYKEDHTQATPDFTSIYFQKTSGGAIFHAKVTSTDKTLQHTVGFGCGLVYHPLRLAY